MKFLILINQKAIIDNALDLDLVDCAIFDLLKDFAHSSKCQKLLDNDKIYYWFSNTLVIEQLPMLKSQSKKSIQRRFDNLVRAKILERHPENQKKGQSFFCFGENYPLVIFDAPWSKMTEPLVKNDQAPQSKMTNYNTINDNTIKIMSVQTPSQMLNSVKTNENTKEKSCAKKESKHLFRESPYFDKQLFKEALSHLSEPLQNADLDFYYQDLLHDSDSHHRKVHDWIAYAQKWMLKAVEMDVLQTLPLIKINSKMQQDTEQNIFSEIQRLSRFEVESFNQEACNAFLEHLRILWKQCADESMRKQITSLSDKTLSQLRKLLDDS